MSSIHKEKNDLPRLGLFGRTALYRGVLFEAKVKPQYPFGYLER